MDNRIVRAARRAGEDKALIGALAVALGSTLVAGTLPELLKLLPGSNKTLAVLLVLGFLVLAVSWIRIHGKSGVGVAVFLKPTPTANWSDDQLVRYAADRRNHHVSFFYVDVDELHPNISQAERTELARRVIEARLKEEKESRGSQRISFYLTCRVSDAYRLGQETFHSGVGSAAARILEFHEIHVQHIPNTPPYRPLPPLVLEVNSNGPRAARAAYPQLTQDLQRAVASFSGTQTAPTNRHALVVNISRHPQRTVEATGAAEGVSSGGYQLGPNDNCDSALIFEYTATNFPNDRAAYNELLKKITEEWPLYLASKVVVGRPSPEGRLFISAPNSLAFALGALLPSSTSVVDHH